MRVLIIEDNAIQALYLKTVMKKMGFAEVETAHTVKQAINLIDEFKPGLMLVDINLEEEKTGIDIVKNLNNEIDIQVIYISGNSDRYYKKQIEETSHIGYLVKPISQYELVKMLNSASILH